MTLDLFAAEAAFAAARVQRREGRRARASRPSNWRVRTHAAARVCARLR